jgi:SAM-dependent methyltransferase
MKMDWKKTLYDSYVSSGQAAELAGSAKDQFRPREFYLRKIIRQFFPADRDARILDVGCGHGALLYFLAQCGYRNAAGVDTSPEQVALAKRLGIDRVQAGDAMGCLKQQPSGSVHVLCVFDVLEHLTRQELFELLEEVRRVLAPGGRCIGHVPNAAGLFGMRIRYGDLTHELAFTPSSLRQVFRALGFASIRCHEDKPAAHGMKSIIRRMLWDIGSAPLRVMLAAETGQTEFILSQNLLFVAQK